MEGLFKFCAYVAVGTLAVCVITATLNSVFDDTPRPLSAYELSRKACYEQGGVPIIDEDDSGRLEECQFKEK